MGQVSSQRLRTLFTSAQSDASLFGKNSHFDVGIRPEPPSREVLSAGGGTRTRTEVALPRILSPLTVESELGEMSAQILLVALLTVVVLLPFP
jgi:hypothetical protein